MRVLTDEEMKKIKSGPVFDESNFGDDGINKIYYGTPGCGKSHTVDLDYPKSRYSIIRTVFHPEYSNSDFIGQIVPKLVSIEEGKKISYEFEKGPFVNALIKAYNNPKQSVVLIIEEIYRGNASAIFGDIFQLLDRKENGFSRYGLFNKNILDELEKETAYSFDEVKIPGNLSIIATMNTSDQNVFTLDTAFKRRWEMRKISNDFEDKSDDYTRDLGELFIPGSKNSVNWKSFVTTINKAIVEKNQNGLYSEDKQIGIYFVDCSYLCKKDEVASKEKIDKFSNKVLMYIWEDIAKLCPETWFIETKSLDGVFKKIKKLAETDESCKVFKGLFGDISSVEDSGE